MAGLGDESVRALICKERMDSIYEIRQEQGRRRRDTAEIENEVEVLAELPRRYTRWKGTQPG